MTTNTDNAWVWLCCCVQRAMRLHFRYFLLVNIVSNLKLPHYCLQFRWEALMNPFGFKTCAMKNMLLAAIGIGAMSSQTGVKAESLQQKGRNPDLDHKRQKALPNSLLIASRDPAVGRSPRFRRHPKKLGGGQSAMILHNTEP